MFSTITSLRALLEEDKRKGETSLELRFIVRVCLFSIGYFAYICIGFLRVIRGCGGWMKDGIFLYFFYVFFFCFFVIMMLMFEKIIQIFGYL